MNCVASLPAAIFRGTRGQMSTGKFIFKSTVLIAFFNLMSRVLGLVRDMVIASQFGTSVFNDAYQFALKIPSMIFYIISGALATAIVPVFTEYAARGEKAGAWKIFNTLMIAVTLIYLTLALAGIAGAPILVKIVAPGFTGFKSGLTVELVRLVLPLMIFSGLASLFSGLLNANNIFGLPAFSNSVNNIFIIVSCLTIGSLFGIHGLALGTTLAMAAMAAVQFPALYKNGFRFRLAIDLKSPGVRKVRWLAAPAALGIAVNQVNVFINMALASILPEGSYTALVYADKLIQFPLGFFVLALGTAVFPTLALRAAQGDRGKFYDTIVSSLKVVFIIIIPASVGLMVLRFPIIALIFKRGAFDQDSLELTAAALLFYSFGMLGQAAGILLTRGFYAVQDTRTPVKISIVTVLINLALSLALIGSMRHAGLAAANSLANLAYMALLLSFLKKKIPQRSSGGLLKFTLSVIIASALMAVTSHSVCGLLAGPAAGGTMGLAVQVCLAITAGIVVFAATIFILKVEEARLLWRIARETVAKRLRK